jgi:hypothetical protein
MKTQNFQNHAQYFAFHHFVLTPLTLILLVWAVVKLDFSSTESTSTSIYSLLVAIILFLLPLLARIYALKLQNRLILNEMRIRYFHLTGSSFEEKESKLKLGQIIALRFASSDELLGLMDKAIHENLSPKEIKMMVKNWQGDYRRV